MISGASDHYATSDILWRELTFGNRELVGKVIEALRQQRSLVLVYCLLEGYQEIAATAGTRRASGLLAQVQEALVRLVPSLHARVKLLAVKNLWNGAFLVFVSLDGGVLAEERRQLSAALVVLLEESLKLDVLRLGGRFPVFQFGSSSLNDKAGRVEELIYQAVQEAQAELSELSPAVLQALLLEFEAAWQQRRLKITYEPVFSLVDTSVLGWEARLNGPGYFGQQEMLFALAGRVGKLNALEASYHKMALEHFALEDFKGRLFLSTAPFFAPKEPGVARGETLRWPGYKSSTPENLVLVIDEPWQAQQMPLFGRALEYYGAQGYTLAVRSHGISMLPLASDCRFQFLKLSPFLIRGVNVNPRKKALLEALLAYGRRLRCTLVAEGVEDKKEFLALANLQLDAAQGPLLSRLRKEEIAPVKRFTFPRTPTRGHSISIGRIADNAVIVEKDTLVREVKAILEEHETLDGVVVVESGYPVGLVMRYHLDRYLGLQYGVPLYFNRPISSLMDSSFLAVEEHTPIEVVSRLAMKRERLRLYDWIIVTCNRKFRGVVSVQTLVDTLTRLQLEMARGANPLTGLPGRVGIERELLRRAEEGKDCTVVFIDLDNFKSYNDRYGFEKGDRVILFTAHLLVQVTRKLGSEGDFVGHIGGDDFVIIASPERAELVCLRFIRYFDRLIRRFYRPEDRAAGGVKSVDRQGREAFFPFVSVSMVMVEEAGSVYHYDIRRISEAAAEVKHYAKLLPGSVYLRVKRRE
ncbi:diguanylate cyclase domain-containing protein [Desulfothermobacter acidiphilus]|uniref:diguanylate cyclase domain-containing protein n=1 Tax=Desulfothermobacter acidiphilus TaxID=1938353 RepID=UPI003F88D3F3